jgi:hypothetical protein
MALAWTAMTVGANTQSRGKKTTKKPCATDLAHCGNEGCGHQFDPELNKLKNITELSPQAPTTRTLAWMGNLPDPENFTEGGDREELTNMGEGQPITVVAYLIAAKLELDGESCNCGLQTEAETDNHLVLVSKVSVDTYPVTTSAKATSVFHSRESESQTAEFTPRVRLTHPNFTHEKMQPLIDAAPQKALLVRVTGQLLFDSEHLIRHALNRVNNWEIHPVFKLEVCASGNNCKANSSTGWKSIEDEQP